MKYRMKWDEMITDEVKWLGKPDEMERNFPLREGGRRRRRKGVEGVKEEAKGAGEEGGIEEERE